MMNTETIEAVAHSAEPKTEKRLKLHDHVLQTQDESGLQYLEVDNPLATAKIALQGDATFLHP